jgi:hypothetical protein
MDNEFEAGELTFLIPARTLTGNVSQLLGEIDDMIGALEMIREVVLARAPKPANPPKQPWWASLRHAFGRLAIRPDGHRIDSRPMAR